MESVAGGMANEGLNWLFGQFSAWMYGWVYDGLGKAADYILGMTTQATSSFWDVSAINLLLDFSAWVNIVVFVVSLLFLVFDIAEQGGQVQWHIIMTNFFKGIIFVLFNRNIGLMIYQLAVSTTQMLQIDFEAPEISNILELMQVTQQSGLVIILMILVVAVAFIAFFCMSMVRNGTLFVQIFTSSFYITGIIRGDTAKAGEWLRQTIAISATYFMQYLMFYLGLNSLTGGTGSSMITTFTCWLTMFFVPKIMDRFGYASGAASVFSAAGSVAGAGLSVVR